MDDQKNLSYELCGAPSQMSPPVALSSLWLPPDSGTYDLCVEALLHVFFPPTYMVSIKLFVFLAVDASAP